MEWSPTSAELGLGCIVCLSALMLGGAHIAVVLAGTTGIVLCGALALSSGALRRIPAPAIVLAALGVYSLVQTVPLPVSVLHRLSPGAADTWQRSLLPFGERVARGSVSLDPGASSVEAAKWLSYAIAFSLAAAFGRRRGKAPAIALVFGSALTVALATLAHGLVGASRVFGIYQPQLGTSSEHVGPILNPNCLAGYLTLGALCGFGFIVSSKNHSLRWLWAMGTAVVIGVDVLSGSRGGVLTLVAGLAVVAFLAYRTYHRRGSRRLHWYDWAGSCAAVLAAGAFSLLGIKDSWFELSDKDVSKLKMARWVEPMVRDFPLFGVGRGAFESTFPIYKPIAGNQVFTHPENILAQWVSEWGIVASALGLGFLLWQLRPRRLGFGRSELASAALVGVGAVVAQNFVDFGLELFAPMLAVTTVLGACWGQHAAKPPAQPNSKSLGGLALLALTVLSIGLSLVRGRSPVSLERAALSREYGELKAPSTSSARPLWARLRLAMERHPAEPFFPRLGAVLALRLGNVEPLPWIERALEQGPVDSRT
ncbi:MAG TPA: O-antigen ligase family protein, partial [Polyangiaceae bacterium]